jgi:hypothetical protein
MKNFEISLLCVIRNIVSLILFTYLAIAFGKWWIVLFAAFFTCSVETKVIERGSDDDK